VGFHVASGEQFQLLCAAGGGFGDPLDRSLAMVSEDIAEHRLERHIAGEIYGVEFRTDGSPDAAATTSRRAAMRRERLSRASEPSTVVAARPAADAELLPLYPGVVQCGAFAVAEKSGAVLAQAPGDWLDGCKVIETAANNHGRDLVTRAYLDPLTGRQLFFETVAPGVGRSIQVAPARWTRAASAPPTPVSNRQQPGC
jgi:N-methylhydantoinase B